MRAAARPRKGKVRWEGRSEERRRRRKREKERCGVEGEEEVVRMRGSSSGVERVRPSRWRRSSGGRGSGSRILPEEWKSKGGNGLHRH
jgi:hypothetical protein